MSTTLNHLVGSFVALVTPFTESGEVDMSSLAKLVDFHLDNNTDGLVLLGTTGEAATISEQEKQLIVTKTRQQVDKSGLNIPIIVGTGSNCTKTTIEQTELAKGWGADAALVVTPYYNKPTQEGLIAHFTAVAESTDLAIILYNVPGRTACDMAPETVAKLAKISNITGIKEAVGTSDRIKELSKLKDSLSLLSGDDETFIDLLKAGGHGTVSVTANISPAKMTAICKAARDQDWTTVDNLNSNLLDLHKNLFVSANPMPVKWALYHMGLIKSPSCRLPLMVLANKYHDGIIGALSKAGVI